MHLPALSTAAIVLHYDLFNITTIKNMQMLLIRLLWILLVIYVFSFFVCVFASVM
jgi:hypothetical protein